MNLTVHTDGGALNNPGPAACAFVIHNENKLVKEASFYLGNQTNNVAEYMGVIHALEELLSLSKNHKIQSCVFVLDSLLLVNQINGVYRVRQEHLKPLMLRIKTLISQVGISITFTHTLREGNTQADSLVKKELSLYS